MRSWYSHDVASPMQRVLLFFNSLAAVCVQPNITWHAYDAAWSTQREGVNCLCSTAMQTTLLPGFFYHVATAAAAAHLIHWLTVWGFLDSQLIAKMNALCKEVFLFLTKIVQVPQELRNHSLGSLFCLAGINTKHAWKKWSKPFRVGFVTHSNRRVLLFPNKNTWKTPVKLKDGIHVFLV